MSNQPYKRLAAEDAALVLIDHQVISMSLIKTQPPEISKANNIALVKAAKALGIPSVWTSSTEIENEDWWMDGLEEIDPNSYANRIMRTGIVDSWNDSAFVSAIEDTGRKTLIMSGTTTDGCLLYTALNARAAGYEVHVPLDACGSPFQISEDAARVRLNNAGVVLSATNTVLGELALDWATSDGQKLRQILGETFQHTIGGFGLSK